MDGDYAQASLVRIRDKTYQSTLAIKRAGRIYMCIRVQGVLRGEEIIDNSVHKASFDADSIEKALEESKRQEIGHSRGGILFRRTGEEVDMLYNSGTPLRSIEDADHLSYQTERDIDGCRVNNHYEIERKGMDTELRRRRTVKRQGETVEEEDWKAETGYLVIPTEEIKVLAKVTQDEANMWDMLFRELVVKAEDRHETIVRIRFPEQ